MWKDEYVRAALGKGELGCEFTRRMSSDMGVNLGLTEQSRALRPDVEVCSGGGSLFGGLMSSGRKFFRIICVSKVA